MPHKVEVTSSNHLFPPPFWEKNISEQFCKIEMKVNIIIIFTPRVQNILVDVSCMIWIIGSMEIPSL